MKLNTQREQILHHLKTKGSITPLEALQQYGCFRLAAAIHVLRKEHSIATHMITIGEGNPFARYVFKTEYKQTTLNI